MTITGSMTVFWVSTGIILFNCFALGWLILPARSQGASRMKDALYLFLLGFIAGSAVVGIVGAAVWVLFAGMVLLAMLSFVIGAFR